MDQGSINVTRLKEAVFGIIDFWFAVFAHFLHAVNNGKAIVAFFPCLALN